MANVSQVECVGDGEMAPIIAANESSNVISSPPPSRRMKRSTKESYTFDSSLLIDPLLIVLNSFCVHLQCSYLFVYMDGLYILLNDFET